MWPLKGSRGVAHSYNTGTSPRMATMHIADALVSSCDIYVIYNIYGTIIGE